MLISYAVTPEVTDYSGTTPPSSPPAETSYLDAAERARLAQDRERHRSRGISYARLAVFLAATACLLSLFPGPVHHAWLRLALALGGYLLFLGLVYWHSQVEARERWYETLALVNREAAARVVRSWSDLAAVPTDGAPAEHPYAEDLDIHGRASLFQLLGWVGTEAGRQTLGAWLLAPARPEVVRERQQAVAELAAMPALREEVAALGRLVEPSRRDLEVFFAWAEQGTWLRRRPWLLWSARLLGAGTVGLIAAQVAGVIERPWWIGTLLMATASMAVWGKRIFHTFQLAFSRDRQFQQHATLFARIAETTFRSPRLRQLQESLGRSGLTAAREMSRLATIRQYAELRLVPMLHPFIAFPTLWDFHVLAALEAWQLRAAPHLRAWFAVMGEFDGLAALASLAHDNPTWAFPRIDEHADRLTASRLGHPLLAASRRVANDVEIGPPGSFLLVTGSNMSGKSTLLRAVGLNVVLAQAGAPVCAERMVLPPLAICTSMRVQDSLEAGVSYFMAALERLKLVVSMARATGPTDPMLLYLLDEVLQGTNTAERQVAVRRIQQHLLSLRAIGAVTTHDLELASCETLASASRPVHFTEGVESDAGEVRLSFDYTLKPGVATSRNALKLLHLVGLD